MARRDDLLSTKSAKTDTFVYTPPAAAFDATRILVRVDADEPSPVVAKVLRGLRRANPNGRILVLGRAGVREVYEDSAVLDDNMRAADTGDLLMQEYEHALIDPVGKQQAVSLPYTPVVTSVTAPGYIGEYDCCITVATFRQPLSALASLRTCIEPDAEIPAAGVPDFLADLYFTIGHHVDGAVLGIPDVGQVVWGDDLLAVDEAACRLAQQPAPEILKFMQQHRPA